MKYHLIYLDFDNQPSYLGTFDDLDSLNSAIVENANFFLDENSDEDCKISSVKDMEKVDMGCDRGCDSFVYYYYEHDLSEGRYFVQGVEDDK